MTKKKRVNYMLGKLYLRSWSTQLVCVHTVIPTHEIVVRQVEQLFDPVLDFWLLQVVFVHPGQVLASLILIRLMDSPLARQNSSAKEVANHARPIQTTSR